MMSRSLVLASFLILLPVAVFTSTVQAQEIETVLRLEQRVSMEKLAQNVMDPHSSRYRVFYSPEEIRDIAAPSRSDYSALLNQLQSKGFRIVSESKTHLFVTVSADHSIYEQVFSTPIIFKTESRHTNLSEPRVPSELGLIHSVIGLDNTRMSKHAHSAYSAYPKTPAQISGNRSGPLEPPYIHNVYGFDPIYKSGIIGRGQHIAIATYDGFFPLDVATYYVMENISPVPQVDVVEFNGHPDVNLDSAGETELDSEFSGAIAPGAQIHVFTSAHNNDAGEVQLFTAILDDNRAKVANYSWGDCEANETAQHAADMNQVFARAVAQGVNVTIASGDSGSYGCPSSDDAVKGAPAKVNADFPASNPYVIAVGGTSVDGGSDGNVQETAWDQAGGGVSVLYDRPSWQQGFPSPFLKRSFPDVAFNADPNTGQNAFVHVQMGQTEWLQYGGTSIAAPQWAGFLALVGEARAGKPGLGFLNPLIYPMSDDQKSQAFHDVTHGNNGAYKAGVGWDAVTGWGSMRASVLLDYLKN